jgi:hypothetical protein
MPFQPGLLPLNFAPAQQTKNNRLSILQLKDSIDRKKSLEIKMKNIGCNQQYAL